jgi:hypothetical protein
MFLGDLGDPLGWDHWTSTWVFAARAAISAVLEKPSIVPVEVQIASVMDEPLLTFLIERNDPKNWGHILQTDELRWQAPDIYPVTVTATDKTGEVSQWQVDPRPKTVC